MAHIQIRRKGGRSIPTQLIIDGVDVTQEVYRDLELVEVGDDPEWAEVGLRVTFVVSRLDLDHEADVVVTDQFRSVATRVRSMTEGDD